MYSLLSLFTRNLKERAQDFDHPLLTMNAIATNSDDASSSHVKDSIIIGDGVLQFLYDSGLQSSGPDFVHAHEFGHHVQFQIDMTVPPGSSYTNDDRREELMADAIGGYYSAHDLGANMSPEEIATFHKAAFSTGDCSVEDNEDHHGLPLQRQCAAIWGASLAALQEDGGGVGGGGVITPILDPQVFVNSFNSAYESILKMDTMACTLILEQEETETTSTSMSTSTSSSIEVEDQPPLQETIYNEVQAQSSEEDGSTAEPSPPFYPAELDLSWESRGKPDSKIPLPSKISSKGETEDESTVVAYAHFTGRGTPEETEDIILLNHEFDERDYDLPWVYCYFSSGNARDSYPASGFYSPC